MLIVKFKKVDYLIYISHIDMQRIISRTLTRAQIDVKLSNGFNPHQLIKLSPPIPLGIESYSEYVAIDTAGYDISTILDRLNQNSPKGICYLRAWQTALNPNLAAKIVAAEYSLGTAKAYEIADKLKTGLARSLVIQNKKGLIAKECKDMLRSIEIDKIGLTAVLSFGNISLRADRFAISLNQNFDLDINLYDIRKNKAFIELEGGLVDVDDYLTNLEKGGLK